MDQSVIDKPASDDQLLKAYAHDGSQDALGQLVHRHIDFVYAAARRQLSDPQAAEDATQAVFIVLAKKARQLAGQNSLPGWLMKTTHFAARDIIKKETRRKHYEREAAQMRSTITATESAAAGPSSEEFGEELDAALAQLGQTDRNAIALRYLHGLSMNEAAVSLAISPEAATKRIARAVARLRKILLGRGIIAPSVALPALLDQLPHVVAPAHLATAITSTITGGAATGAGLSIAQGVTHMMTAAKIKAASVLVAGILLATGAGVGGMKLLAQETAVPAPDAGPNPPPAPGQVVPNPSTSTAIGQLNNGVSIEIVGVCESPSRGKQWWDATGAPLDKGLYDGMRFGNQHPDPGYVAREVAVRINSAVQGSSDHATVYWGLDDSPNSFSGGTRGNLAKDVQATGFHVKDNPAGATLRANVAAGKWTTLVTDASGGSMSTGMLGMEFVFSAPYRVNNETHIMVAAIGANAGDTRLVVVDKSGKQHVAQGYSSAGSQNGFAGEFGVNLPIASIRSCEFQTRPFDQWIEIKNISLHAGKMTNVQVSTSDPKPK
jgi:RNA polymerase sigma factor (sigma-70 family)